MKELRIESDRLVYDRRELYAYLRIKGEPDAATEALIARANTEIGAAIRLTLLYRVLPLPSIFASRTVNARLFGCDRALFFTVSLGAECDRVIRRAESLSSAYGAVADAVASAYAEAAAAAVEELLVKECGGGIRSRISPGYGDFPLSAQAEIHRALGCEKHGICLLPSMLTLPMKTVTAVIGIEKGTEL